MKKEAARSVPVGEPMAELPGETSWPAAGLGGVVYPKELAPQAGGKENETFSLTYKSSSMYTAELLTSKSLRIVALSGALIHSSGLCLLCGECFVSCL